MIKGIYTAVSAMIAGLNRQVLKSHNMTNLNTPGFKQVISSLEEFKASNTQAMQTAPLRQAVNPGQGVMTTETRSVFTNGALLATDQPLDLAIQGDGFFRIMTPDGERYTRDGRFNRDSNGSLVTVDGNFVLDPSGAPIKISNGQPTVDASGGIFIDDTLVTHLGIAEFAQPQEQLQMDSGNLFRALEPPLQGASNTSIHQGSLEMSNVNLADMMIGSGTYEAAQKMVQIQDELLGKTINSLR